MSSKNEVVSVHQEIVDVVKSGSKSRLRKLRRQLMGEMGFWPASRAALKAHVSRRYRGRVRQSAHEFIDTLD